MTMLGDWSQEVVFWGHKNQNGERHRRSKDISVNIKAAWFNLLSKLIHLYRPLKNLFLDISNMKQILLLSLGPLACASGNTDLSNQKPRKLALLLSGTKETSQKIYSSR